MLGIASNTAVEPELAIRRAKLCEMATEVRVSRLHTPSVHQEDQHHGLAGRCATAGHEQA